MDASGMIARYLDYLQNSNLYFYRDLLGWVRPVPGDFASQLAPDEA
jgi:hypothetical protein